GYPKLLELADGLAADRPVLAARVAATADELADRADVLDAFLAAGTAREGETRQAEADFGQVAAGGDGERRGSPDAHGWAALRVLVPPGAGRPQARGRCGELAGRLDAAGRGAHRGRGRSGRAGAGGAGGAGGARSRQPGGRGAPGPRRGAAAS